jgi:processive 1,2-diacylglycerol beta-glucosyltransferase
VLGPRILILTLSHGASHQRASNALRSALLAQQPEATVEVADALEHCPPWFRAYYNSYEIPLKYWPSLWARIESRQQQSASTGPGWLYRLAARSLFRFIQAFQPDVVVATEVGVCELAALAKRQARLRFLLVGLVLMDFNRAWAQPEVDLYPSVPGEMAEELEAAGVPTAKILPCGLPIDPIFASLPMRAALRAKLEIRDDVPLLLVLFGGTGHGRPKAILEQLRKVQQPLQAAFVAGKSRRLEEEMRRLSKALPQSRVMGWVDNIHEWMTAADLLVSKPRGSTLMEAAACGLPILALDPLPGNERRTAARIEKWGVGRWLQSPEELAPAIERLLAFPEELARLREAARAWARSHAAREAAQAILQLAEKK